MRSQQLSVRQMGRFLGEKSFDRCLEAGCRAIESTWPSRPASGGLFVSASGCRPSGQWSCKQQA
jgi:hypothetical protein